jgi:ferredoxin
MRQVGRRNMHEVESGGLVHSWDERSYVLAIGSEGGVPWACSAEDGPCSTCTVNVRAKQAAATATLRPKRQWIRYCVYPRSSLYKNATCHSNRRLPCVLQDGYQNSIGWSNTVTQEKALPMSIPTRRGRKAGYRKIACLQYAVYR